MKILVAGSSGLIGSALVQRLLRDDHEVLRLVRRAPIGKNEARWDPAAGSIHASALNGVHAVIHLGGASIAGKRWNAAYKNEIRASRIDSARLLSQTIAQMTPKPDTLLCASALGYYGNRADQTLTENSSQGSGFLADSTADWEAATNPASNAGVRVCNLRIGVVLSANGEMPRKMLPPFKLGIGGKLGNGSQYMSWIHLQDVVDASIHALNTPSLQGPLNLGSPNPVTNAEFTQTLARILSRPAIFTVPEFALRIAMGEMAQFVLASTRMHPQKLLETGFAFTWPHLEPALREVLKK